MPIPRWRFVEYSGDGCSVYQCLNCKHTWTSLTNPAGYSPASRWNFCPYCGCQWTAQHECRAHGIWPSQDMIKPFEIGYYWHLEKRIVYDPAWRDDVESTPWTTETILDGRTPARTVLAELKRMRAVGNCTDWPNGKPLWREEYRVRIIRGQPKRDFFPYWGNEGAWRSSDVARRT